jgi:hypothetical protein
MANTAENNDKQFLWNGPSLLVPLNVEAMVVSSASLNLQWAANKLRYNNAGKFENVRPSMFIGEKPQVGLTLHWALPDGVTHGQQQENRNDITYPPAPNRWLVIRYFNGASKAWILQSDYIDPQNGASPFLDPNASTPTFTRIGKVWPAEQWPGESGVGQQHFLIALGPGNPSFAAFTPNTASVFAFYDDMADIIDKKTAVTYTVIGWYADANDDPLHDFTTSEGWLALMNQLKWTVGTNNDLQKAVNDWAAWAAANGITINSDNPKDIYPSRTICQGMVYNVTWLGRNGPLQSGVPQYDPSMPADKQPRIAIANNGVDALAALVAYEMNLEGADGVAAAELLQAFNYNLLYTYEQPGGEFQLYREIFKAWFGDRDGEDYYYIEDKEKATAPFVDPDRLEKLVSLNKKSASLNLKTYLLRASQQGLYGDWWKTGKSATYWGTPPPGVTKDQWKQIQANLNVAIPKEQAAVEQLKTDIASLTAEIEQLKTEVKDGLPSTQELMMNNANRYHQANDPVVLVYGAERSYRHGEDGRFDENGELFTRFTGQTIAGLKVMIPDQSEQPVTSADVVIPPVKLPAGKVPKETSDLCIETYFFDTLNAEAIAKAACTLLGIAFDTAYTEIVASQQTSAWNADVHEFDKQLVTDASGFMGTIPSVIAVQRWYAPWSPLYMAWEIRWFPSYDTPADALKKWTFDAESLEYAWNEQYQPGGTGVTLSGYNLITPKSAYVLRTQLEKYFHDTGKFPDLEKFLNTVSNWDFLTQNMGGLSDLLVTLTADQLNQPPTNISNSVEDMTQQSPVPDQSAGFYPVRAGHIQITKLWVIDDFGQVFDPISAVGQTPASYHPVIGTGMVTPGNANLIQLPPRVTQSSRFTFNFVNGSGANNDSILENQMTNPLCGWMLPNHLDKALSLYTPDGELLGELLLTGNEQVKKLRWDNAPGKNVAVGTPLSAIIDNQYMLAFVEQLLAQEDSAAAFEDYLAIIDETLWSVEPLGGRNNELISVFIGRPLALVRSIMKYNLMDDLVFNQSWLDSTLHVTEDYETIKFPVQVGCIQNPQDGTIGYFFDNFSTFNTILSASAPLASGYITDNPVSLNFKDEQKNVFIVVDPRGEVNTITGILPVQTNVLPGPLVETAMANMNVTFRTGPLITNPDQLSMPLPSEMSGTWSWIQHTGVTTWEEISQIAQANQKAQLLPYYELKDGWLKLSNALINDSDT